MRISLFSALLMGLVIFSSCEKEDEPDNNDNIKKHYEGDWQMETDQNQSGGDSSFVISINAEGAFSELVDLQTMSGTVTGTLNGAVNNNGGVNGTLNISGATAGNVDGNLNTAGTGSGNFYLVTGDTLAWSALKL